MIHTVIWRPIAENKLADLWTTAPDRQSVAVAANRIDAALRVDPGNQGESRDGTRRVYFVEPLAVLYSIDEGDLMVHVLDVWRV